MDMQYKYYRDNAFQNLKCVSEPVFLEKPLILRMVGGLGGRPSRVLGAVHKVRKSFLFRDLGGLAPLAPV